MEMVTK
ncbi:hypothetical protein OIU74_016580 [Salix koriyanagi]|nr:hypothetical protein OIU74_016580 [Salix koriyanagi]